MTVRLAPLAENTASPTLADLGFQPVDLHLTPGEAGALRLFEEFRQRIDRYHESRDFPGIKGPSYLSVHLRFGTISIRELVRFARRHGGEGAETWLSELIWREFYQMLLWHHPDTVEHAFQRKFAALSWPNPPGHLEAWQEARTGYPIVDAAMRQLAQTGAMHNRLRMIAASFLCKDLHVDWRLGERHFAEKLLDYYQAANVGGWQWSASLGTDAQPWFRIFNPVTQSQKFDPRGVFIRRHLPELARVPDKYLHAPWQMPANLQEDCGVVVGRDYPPPLVDHAAARAQTLTLFSAIAQA
jgi:deoxyribodipyrimidine photo-lyase